MRIVICARPIDQTCVSQASQPLRRVIPASPPTFPPPFPATRWRTASGEADRRSARGRFLRRDGESATLSAARGAASAALGRLVGRISRASWPSPDQSGTSIRPRGFNPKATYSSVAARYARAVNRRFTVRRCKLWSKPSPTLRPNAVHACKQRFNRSPSTSSALIESYALPISHQLNPRHAPMPRRRRLSSRCSHSYL